MRNLTRRRFVATTGTALLAAEAVTARAQAPGPAGRLQSWKLAARARALGHLRNAGR